MTLFQFLRWGREHYDLVEKLMTAVTELPSATSFEERWNILKPLGDSLAPAIDEMFAFSAQPSSSETFDVQLDEFKIGFNEYLSKDGYATSDYEWLNDALMLLMWYARK